MSHVVKCVKTQAFINTTLNTKQESAAWMTLQLLQWKKIHQAKSIGSEAHHFFDKCVIVYRHIRYSRRMIT